jgi:uroporphyrin-III C-methyltransferase
MKVFEASGDLMTKAYLVGAGPGDPRLLTIAALEAMRLADIVLWDRLVSEGILALVNPSAEKIYVGKEEGEQEKAQRTIFDYFEKFAKSELTIVRLKGGDPYIFGRGCEEYATLQKLGYEVEIVPGVSTAIGLPTLVGIPLTAREVSSGFAVLTGHTAKDQSVDWHAYSKVDTLVILMAVKERVRIADALISVGRSEDEPIAFIENGSLANQRVVRSTLGLMRAGSVEVSSPAVLVVGAVSALPDSARVLEQINAGTVAAVENVAQSADQIHFKPLVEIEYCPKCRWLLRSSWMAQELLTTFEAELGGVALKPSEVSGAFEVRVDGRTVWSRAAQGRFPDIKELKKVVRDVAAPDKNLGHSDR